MEFKIIRAMLRGDKFKKMEKNFKEIALLATSILKKLCLNNAAEVMLELFPAYNKLSMRLTLTEREGGAEELLVLVVQVENNQVSWWQSNHGGTYYFVESYTTLIPEELKTFIDERGVNPLEAINKLKRLLEIIPEMSFDAKDHY